jgi:hypothetical protein
MVQKPNARRKRQMALPFKFSNKKADEIAGLSEFLEAMP